MSTTTEAQPRAANRLSNELVLLILQHLHPGFDRPVAVDRRQFLSVESFHVPQPSSDSIQDVGRFRLASRLFAELGAECLFDRVTVRLSSDGLERLDQLTQWPQLARHVRKFSYLVPNFYMHGLIPSRELLRDMCEEFNPRTVYGFMERVQAIRRLTDAGEDLRSITRAFAAFTSLQHIQLLRVQSDTDNNTIAVFRFHHFIPGWPSLDWGPACSHAAKTICAALIAARNTQCCRFSSPMMASDAVDLLGLRPDDLSVLAERLTCLTLHFDNAAALNSRYISRISGHFRSVFTAAKNLQALHVGFPAVSPLELPLQSVFHGITWERLVAFGIQGWKVDAEEILDMAYRHRERLRGLRLRDVLLKQGSAWKDVLVGLHSTMHALQWISLRRIGYADHFESLNLRWGVEVRDDLLSDTDSDAVEDDAMTVSSEQRRHDEDQEEMVDESDDEQAPALDRFELPIFDPAVVTGTSSKCGAVTTSNEDRGIDLSDDGTAISKAKRKAWEQWVIHKVP